MRQTYIFTMLLTLPDEIISWILYLSEPNDIRAVFATCHQAHEMAVSGRAYASWPKIGAKFAFYIIINVHRGAFEAMKKYHSATLAAISQYGYMSSNYERCLTLCSYSSALLGVTNSLRKAKAAAKSRLNLAFEILSQTFITKLLSLDAIMVMRDMDMICEYCSVMTFSPDSDGHITPKRLLSDLVERWIESSAADHDHWRNILDMIHRHERFSPTSIEREVKKLLKDQLFLDDIRNNADSVVFWLIGHNKKALSLSKIAKIAKYSGHDNSQFWRKIFHDRGIIEKDLQVPCLLTSGPVFLYELMRHWEQNPRHGMVKRLLNCEWISYLYRDLISQRNMTSLSVIKYINSLDENIFGLDIDCENGRQGVLACIRSIYKVCSEAGLAGAKSFIGQNYHAYLDNIDHYVADNGTPLHNIISDITGLSVPPDFDSEAMNDLKHWRPLNINDSID